MIKLAEALQGVSRLGFDTAPLIYLVERHPDYIHNYIHTIREFFRLVDVGSIEVITGMISFAEVLVVPK